MAHGSMCVAAHDHIRVSPSKNRLGVGAQGTRFRPIRGVVLSQKGAAAVAHALGQFHGPIWVDQSKSAHDKRVAGNTLIGPVAPVFGINTVAMDEVSP